MELELHDFIGQAIHKLDPNVVFAIYGKVNNENDYLEKVKFISGEDDIGSSVFSDTQTFTWSQVKTKADELKAEYDGLKYQRDREIEYPPMADYLDAIVKGDETQKQKYINDCLAVKEKYPK